MKRPVRHTDRPSSLSLQQLARRWSMPRREVRRLLQRGELRFEQVLGQLRVPFDSVRLFEKTRSLEPGSVTKKRSSDESGRR